MIYTTFNLLKEAGACKDEYNLLAKTLGGITKYGKEADIPLSTILEMQPNGCSNTLWALQCCTKPEKARRISQIFTCDCAEHVVHIYEKKYPEDKRPRDCIAVARRFIEGKATKDELDAAWAAGDAARAAAWAAAWAAGDAAWDAAGAAAWDAAWAAAGDAEYKWQTKRLMEYLYPKEAK